MSITLEQLKAFNDAVDSKKEDDAAPTPVLLLNKYRVRLLPLADLPIITHHSNLSQLALNSESVLVIDSPVDSEKPECRKLPTKTQNVCSDEKMDIEIIEKDENDKENVGGPLETTFLTLDKLQKGAVVVGDVEIEGFDIAAATFDVNPIGYSEAGVLHRLIRHNPTTHFSSPIHQYPIWISTFTDSLPHICWMSAGITQKNRQVTGITRVLGYLDENSEKLVNQLNASCGAGTVSRYRAVYDEIRKIRTAKLPCPGEVVLEMRWNSNGSVVLLDKPVNAAECTIRIDLGLQDSRFFADKSLYSELFFVLNLANVLAHPENEVLFPSCTEKFDVLVKEINSLVEKCSEDDKVLISGDTEEVTHHVWQIVRRCSDIKQATMLLKNFMQALTYKKIKSHVQESNKSHLASLIRSSKTGDFRMPILERLSTIEMMMEIGAESLRGRIIRNFSEKVAFPSEELKLILEACENDLKNSDVAVNAHAISLLPVAMGLATVSHIHSLLNEKDQVILPDVTRRVLQKYTKGMVEAMKRGENENEYIYETTLPVLRIKKEAFMAKRPRVWSCENMRTVGANVLSRMMTALELECPLYRVVDAVNSIRPHKEEGDHNQEKALDLNSDYTVSHTVFSFMPKM